MTLRHFPCTPSGWSGTGLIYEESQLIFTTTLTYVVDFLKYTLSCSHGQEEAHPPPQKRQKLAQICTQSDSVTTIHTLHFICGWNKKAQKHCYNHFKRFTSSCVKIGRLNTIPVGNVATIIVYKITSHCEGTVQMREESQSGIRKWEEIIDIARIFCWGGWQLRRQDQDAEECKTSFGVFRAWKITNDSHKSVIFDISAAYI